MRILSDEFICSRINKTKGKLRNKFYFEELSNPEEIKAFFE